MNSSSSTRWVIMTTEDCGTFEMISPVARIARPGGSKSTTQTSGFSRTAAATAASASSASEQSAASASAIRMPVLVAR